MNRAYLVHDARLVRARLATVLATAHQIAEEGDSARASSLSEVAVQLTAEASRLDAEIAILDLWP